MRNFIRILIGILWGMSVVHAETEALVSCSPIKLKEENKMIILPGPTTPGSSQIYLLKNTSKQAIWLDHPNAKRSMNAGWSSYLRTGNWSAFLSNRSNFVLNCAVIKPGLVDYIDCAHVISVCVPKQVMTKEPAKKTYWLVEDKTWDDMIKAMKKRGVTIK